MSFLFPRKEKEMSTTPNYNINYEDEQFKKVEAERDQALNQNEQQYGAMIGNADKYYQDLIDQSKEYADKQAEIQNQNKDFAIEKIEQQREQAKKDYTREQSGAYVDWQKQSNAYGVQAEQMAQQGLVGSGYSESSQVAMFTAYQNRVATARETMAQANMNFDNGIKDAILQNNSAIAEIYANAHKEQLQISLEGFQYKNNLLENQMEKEMQLKQYYSNEWQNVLNQMNTENALAEEVRQFNENLAMQQKQLQEEIRQFEQNYSLKVKEYEENIRQFNVEIERLKAQDKADAQYKAQQLELQKQQLAEEKRQFDMEYQLQKKQYEVSNNNFNNSYKTTGSSVTTSGGTYSLNGGQGSSGANANANKKQSTSGYKPLYSVGSGGAFGNNASTKAKKDYYFSNGYQPRYIDNVKLTQATSGKTKLTVGDLSDDVIKGLGVPTTQAIWQANGRCYVWNGKTKEYMYIGKA